MSEALINWFMVTLGGKVGKEFILFLISMVPIRNCVEDCLQQDRHF